MAMKLFSTILYVPDVERAAAFYERAFGLRRRLVDPAGIYVAMSTGETTLAFASQAFVHGNGLRFAPVDRAGDPPGIEINFVTENVRAAFERAVSAGGEAWLEPAEQPWGQTVSYVRDPFGFLVEIASPPPQWPPPPDGDDDARDGD